MLADTAPAGQAVVQGNQEQVPAPPTGGIVRWFGEGRCL
jgi:hypothetical protein